MHWSRLVFNKEILGSGRCDFSIESVKKVLDIQCFKILYNQSNGVDPNQKRKRKRILLWKGFKIQVQ